MDVERKDIYYLDANAFYQYIDFDLPEIGLSSKINMDILIKVMDSAKNVILPSCVFTEIFLRFYDKPNILMKIKEFIIKKNIFIQQAGTFIMAENDGKTSIINALSGEKCHVLREELLNQKIADEAGIIYCFVTIITNEYMLYKIRSDSPKQLEIYVSGIIHYIENTREDKTIAFIKKQLEFGYNNKKNKSQDLIYTLLYSFYFMANNLSEELKRIITNGTLDGNHIYQAIRKIYNTSDYNVCVIDKKKCSDLLLKNRSTALIDELKELLPFTLKGHGYNELQIKYFLFLIDKWLYDKRPIKKNDVYDFIFLGCSRNEGSVLITFDEMMLKYFKEVNESNYNIIEKFLK